MKASATFAVACSLDGLLVGIFASAGDGPAIVIAACIGVFILAVFVLCDAAYRRHHVNREANRLTIEAIRPLTRETADMAEVTESLRRQLRRYQRREP